MTEENEARDEARVSEGQLVGLRDEADTEPGDIRLSWIYRLRKDEIDVELTKFRLSLSGTVDDKKRRLVRFIREGCASPRPTTAPPVFPLPPPPLVVPTISGPLPGIANETTGAGMSVSSVCEKVRKWNLHFNGKTDAVEFLEKLCEFQEHSDIPNSALLPALYEIFQGNALAWYRNNRSLWNSWDDFITDFKYFYLPANFQSYLEDQIYNRRQLSGETGRDYVVALQTLLRRHGEFSPERALQRLYGNLQPEYRQYIRQSDVLSIRDLVCQIEEYEALQRELVASRPTKPPATQPTAYQRRTYATVAVEPPSPPPSRPPGTSPVVREGTVSQWKRQDRPTGPPLNAAASDRGREATRSPPSTSGARAAFDRSAICWRCGKTGHFRTQCREPPRLFCSRCGRAGVMTRDCRCTEAGNATGTET